MDYHITTLSLYGGFEIKQANFTKKTYTLKNVIIPCQGHIVCSIYISQIFGHTVCYLTINTFK